MNSITCCELHSEHSLRFKDNKNQYLLQTYFYVAQTLTVEEMKAQLQQLASSKTMKISQNDQNKQRQKQQ